jgi:hypothetical protein
MMQSVFLEPQSCRISKQPLFPNIETQRPQRIILPICGKPFKAHPEAWSAARKARKMSLFLSPMLRTRGGSHRGSGAPPARIFATKPLQNET